MRFVPWIVAGGLTFALCALSLFGQPAEYDCLNFSVFKGFFFAGTRLHPR